MTIPESPDPPDSQPLQGARPLGPQPRRSRWIRITSAAGSGRYNARIQIGNGTATISSSSALNLANLLQDLNKSDDCIFQNDAESGASGNALKVDGTLYLLAEPAPWLTTDAAPKPVYSGYAPC